MTKLSEKDRKKIVIFYSKKNKTMRQIADFFKIDISLVSRYIKAHEKKYNVSFKRKCYEILNKKNLDIIKSISDSNKNLKAAEIMKIFMEKTGINRKIPISLIYRAHTILKIRREILNKKNLSIIKTMVASNPQWKIYQYLEKFEKETGRKITSVTMLNAFKKLNIIRIYYRK